MVKPPFKQNQIVLFEGELYKYIGSETVMGEKGVPFSRYKFIDLNEHFIVKFEKMDFVRLSNPPKIMKKFLEGE